VPDFFDECASQRVRPCGGRCFAARFMSMLTFVLTVMPTFMVTFVLTVMPTFMVTFVLT
jgi:hypothetical protein